MGGFKVLGVYLEGQGDLICGLIIMGISGITRWVLGGINLLTKSP